MLKTSPIYNKQFIETMPLGKCDLSISNGYTLWSEEGRANRLSESIINTIHSAIEQGIGGCAILRLAIATGDFSNEVLRWSKQLGETWRVSSEGAVGQTFTWGDGQVESTFAIIILSQDIGLGIIAEDEDAKTFAQGILIHELAHVHDNICYLHNFGLEPILQQGNWISHRLFIARSLWGEFFAESVAYPYTKGSDFSENIRLCITLLKDATNQVNEETIAFLTHQNAGKVWGVAEHKLSAVFNHFGRTLALLLADRQVNGSDKEIDRFLVAVNSVSPKWEQIVYCLLNVLSISGQQLELNTLDCIGEQIDNGFRLVGLEPYK